MRRRLFNLAAAVSLVLCVVTVVLWVHSLYVGGAMFFRHFTAYPDCDLVHTWWLKSAAGGVQAEHHIDHFRKGDGAKLLRWKLSTFRPPYYPFFGIRSLIPSRNRLTPLQQAGFELGNSSSGTPPSVIRGFIVPHWAYVVLFLILPLLWVRYGLPELRGRWRSGQWLCPICGYDLRATPDRCPECGRVAEPTAAATAAR